MIINKKIVKTLAVVTILAIICYVYFNQRLQSTKNSISVTAVTVQVISLKDIPLSYEYPGRTIGSQEVEIRSRISGLLLERYYKEGEKVKENDPLFKIDPNPYKIAQAQAQAKFNLAEHNWKRITNLYREKVISTQTYEEAKNEFDQAKSGLELANMNLSYATITAPCPGIVSKQEIDPGNLVQANNSLLTRLIRLDPIYVDFAYPDIDIIEQKQALAIGNIALPSDEKVIAAIKLENEATYIYEGTVDFTDSFINNDTGTVRARAIIPNPQGQLLPGQFVRIQLKGFFKKSAISIPSKAIMQGPQGTFVYAVDQSGNAIIKPITLSKSYQNNQTIVSGLEEGDKIIIEGMIKVHPGSPVTATYWQDNDKHPLFKMK